MTARIKLLLVATCIFVDCLPWVSRKTNIIEGDPVHYTPKPQFNVYFAPEEDCGEVAARYIMRAEKSVLIQSYSITSQPIIQALQDVIKRKVRVGIILDRSGEGEESTDYLRNPGAHIYIDTVDSKVHSNTIIVDNKCVLTGSFDFSQKDEEAVTDNLLVIYHPPLATLYSQEWLKHTDHSLRYQKDQEEQ